MGVGKKDGEREKKREGERRKRGMGEMTDTERE